jgi:hypothetical protein
MESNARDPTRYKVGRLIEAYDLAGLGGELERRWQGEAEERASLRELATDFNRELVRAAFRDADRDRFDGDADRVFRLLTDDEVNRGDRLRARRELDRAGVDAEALTGDFVTYQAIRSYLKECRGVRSPDPDPDRRENARTAIQALAGRLTRVTETKLDSLQSAGDLALGDYRVVTSVQVFCEDCSTQRAVDDLLDRGGCECE